MSSHDSFLFYEQEEEILPLLLHTRDADGRTCSCYDCQGIRVRMRQIELMRLATQSEAC